MAVKSSMEQKCQISKEEPEKATGMEK